MTLEIPSSFAAVARALPVLGGIAVLAWRVQETRAPVTVAKIVLPPLGMSTGFAMFLIPSMRIPWSWAAATFAVGFLVLSHPLVRSSSLERRGEEVVMRRTPAFLVVLLALLGVRLALHDYVEHLVSVRQTSAVFFVMAFGMIVRWRARLYWSYRALVEE